ncbi:MAG TPA: hypothetical protein DC049_15575 [Spirochaetia bacterium]|nr:hypothetical protein [Spirochaetia bacterium]
MFFVKSGLVSPWQSVFVSLLLSGLMIFYALLVRNAYINNLLINLDENSPRKLDMLESLKNLNENEADKHLLPLLKGENEQMAVFALETLSSFKTTKYAEEVAGLIDIHFNPKMTRRIFNYFSGECSQKILDKSELIRLKHKEETKIFYLTWAQKYLSFISLQKNLLPFLFDPSFRIQIRSAFLLYISGNHELALQAETFIRNAVSKSSRENVCTILDELANTGDEKLSIFLPDLKLKIDGPALAKNYINALLHISSAAIQEELLEYVVPRREYHGFYIKKIAASKNRDILKLVNAAVISAMPAYSDNTKEFAFLINCLSVMPEKSEACQLEIINFLKKIINVPGMEFSRFRIAECIPAFNLPYNENLKSEIKEIIACENNNLFRDYDDIASFREYDTVFSGIFHDEKNKIIKKRLRFIFNFLNYLYKEQKIDTPLFGLNSPDNNIRASSLEAVENIIDKDIFDMIAPVLENKISSHSPRPASDIMRSLLAVDNYWLNSLGIYFTKVLKLKDLKKEINDYNSYSQFVEKLKKETIAAL